MLLTVVFNVVSFPLAGLLNAEIEDLLEVREGDGKGIKDEDAFLWEP